MQKVTIRVPATTANLGPGFDCLGCALTLYTTISFEETDSGVQITGCDKQYAGKDNPAYIAYCATMAALGEPVGGIHIHIDAQIPISRGLGSSAALLVAGAMSANELHGGRLSKEALLEITNKIEGHPDNLAPALFGGLTASMVENGKPVTTSFPLHPDWIFLALIPDFPLSTSLARSVLPKNLPHADAVYNVSHTCLVLKALETGNEELLRLALQDKVHQPYRRNLIADYDAIEAAAAHAGVSFCISGAGPTLLCMTKNPLAAEALASCLPRITSHSWEILPLKAEFQGALPIDCPVPLLTK